MSMGGARSIARGLRAARPRLLPGALHSLLLAAVALFFLNFNLLGTASPSKRYSQDLVYAWFGDQPWLYPRPLPASTHGAREQPHVVVVIIDEQALALRGAHWPVPLQFHSQFLAELEVLRPRGILLDFLLLDPSPREDICELLGVGARLRADDIRLYLAVTRREDLDALDAAGCRDARGQPLVARHIFTPVSVVRQADDTDFVGRRYPFEQLAAGGRPLPSAAVHMYCGDGRTPASADCLGRLTGAGLANAGFELAWSPQGDPFNQRWSHASCVETASPLQAILNKPALPRESRCPPVATLFATALLSPEADPTLGAANEALFTLADGAFLMVGGNFRGTGDLVTTPLHTLLPGVYYHAVALQNLLAFKGYPKVRKEFRTPKIAFYSYDLLVLWLLAAIFLWRQHWLYGVRPLGLSPFAISPAARSWLAPFFARFPAPVWILCATVLLLCMAAYHDLQLIAVGLIIVAVVIVELRVAGEGEIWERARGLLLYLAAMSLSLAVIVGAVWVGYRWLRLPPGDWLGYFSFAAFGFFVAHTAILEFGRRIDELYAARAASGQPP